MLARQRQDLIVAEVRRHGAVRVSELVALLGVSDMTVRRDLDALDAAGLLEKVHGGATMTGGPSTDEPGFEKKSHRELSEKDAIAAAALRFVRPGSAIALTAGTTTWRLAHHLDRIRDLTVVTNSIPVAEVLDRLERPDLTVVLTGGVRTPSDALVGPVAVAALGSLHVDLVFMGVHGVTERAGFSTPNLLESETNQAFIESAERLVVLADHTKWGVCGLSRIARLEDADVLVSDAGLPAEARRILGEHVEQVVVAPTRERRRAVTGEASG